MEMHEAVREEVVDLWTDLDQTMKRAVNGRWSMECDWILERIDRLAPFVYNPIRRDEIPVDVVYLFDLWTKTRAETFQTIDWRRYVLSLLPDPPATPTRRVTLDEFLEEEQGAR